MPQPCLAIGFILSNRCRCCVCFILFFLFLFWWLNWWECWCCWCLSPGYWLVLSTFWTYDESWKVERVYDSQVKQLCFQLDMLWHWQPKAIHVFLNHCPSIYSKVWKKKRASWPKWNIKQSQFAGANSGHVCWHGVSSSKKKRLVDQLIGSRLGTTVALCQLL